MVDPVVGHLKERLLNYGARVQSTHERMGQFRMVENTYLSIFQALGGMGVLFGNDWTICPCVKKSMGTQTGTGNIRGNRIFVSTFTKHCHE